MLLELPEERDIGPFDAIAVVFGRRSPTTHPYHDDMRRVLLTYLSDLKQDHLAPTPSEEDALIDLLASLGAEGWYKSTLHPEVTRNRSLEWLWNTPSDNSGPNPANIFQGVTLDGLGLQDFDLEHADFSYDSLQHSNFRGANLTNALLTKANLDDSTMSASHLSFANLQGASFRHADLDGADMRFAHLRAKDKQVVDGSYSYAPSINLGNCDCLGAILDGATLSGGTLTRADLENASLRSTVFNEANLMQATFSFVLADNALFVGSYVDHTNFNHASLRNASFRGATIKSSSFHTTDLRGADFAGVKDIDSSSDWTDANIAGVKGLQPVVRLALLREGAVEIVKDSQWKSFVLSRPWKGGVH